MSYNLLAQILGGLTGIGIAYIWYRLDERPHERSTAEARIKFEAEMEEIRKKRQALRKNMSTKTS